MELSIPVARITSVVYLSVALGAIFSRDHYRRNTTPTQVRHLIPFQFSGICRFHEGAITSSIEYVQLNMRRLVNKVIPDYTRKWSTPCLM